MRKKFTFVYNMSQNLSYIPASLSVVRDSIVSNPINQVLINTNINVVFSYVGF